MVDFVDINTEEQEIFLDHTLVKSEPYFISGAFGSAGTLFVMCKNRKAMFKMGYNTVPFDDENNKKSIYEYNYCPICGQKLEKVKSYILDSDPAPLSRMCVV